MAPQTVAAAPSSLTHASIPFLTCSACHGLIAANAASATNSIASSPLDADLHPVDSELVHEIRAMFMTHWNMSSDQADARMQHLNYCGAVAALSAPAPAPSADCQLSPLTISA